MAVFTVKLDDQVSKPAEEAAAAVSSLANEFEHLQQASLAYHAKNSAYQAKSEDSIMADVKKQQEAALARHDADRDAAEGMRKQQEAAAETSKWFQTLTSSAAESTDSLAGVKEMLAGAAGPAATAAVILGVYAKALWEVAKMAVALTQEKEQLAAVFDVFTGGMGGQLLDELEDLAAELPFTADKLNAWAKSLLAAGIKGDALKQSIRAIAAATAIMGEEGGRAAEGLIKRLEMTAAAGGKVAVDRRFLTQLGAAGVSVQALAKQLGVAPEKLSTMTVSAKQLGDAMQKALIAQGEGPLAKLGNTWDSIAGKLREGFEDAFEDLGELVDPFMSELRSLASEFFAGSVASKDFAGGIKGVLKPAFEVATNYVHILHVTFLRLQIAILQVRVWLKPLSDGLGKIGIGAGAANVALYVLVGITATLGVAIAAVGVAMLAVAAPFIIFGLALYGAYRGVSALVGLIGGAIDNLDNLSAAASNAGTEFINGLGNAIASGAAWVVGLITNLASNMVGAIESTLGIESPSRVMMAVGDYTTQGLALGVQAGAPDVQAAAQGAGMAAVRGTVQGAQAAGGGATAGNGAGVAREVHVHLTGPITIGANDAPTTVEAFVQLLERAAAMAGLGVPQGT